MTLREVLRSRLSRTRWEPHPQQGDVAQLPAPDDDNERISYASSTGVSSTGTPFRLSQSTGSSGGEWSYPVLGWKPSETGKNRPSTGNLGPFRGWIGPFFQTIAQPMRRCSTPATEPPHAVGNGIARFDPPVPSIDPSAEWTAHQWSMLFHGIRRLGIRYEIETRPTERTSTVASTVLGWSRSFV